MAIDLSRSLNPDKALIFRITHRANLPWLLEHGLTCRSAAEQDPEFITIGKPELIEKRTRRAVPVPPGGVLSDYIPFYFTPASMMLYNIVTGHGVPRQNRGDIIVLVTSLPHLRQLGLPFLFSDRHAYLANAEFSNRLEDLAEFVPWRLLQSKDFKRDLENPDKTDRYQAEALIHRHLPVSALLGIGTYTDEMRSAVEVQVAAHQLPLKVVTRPNWFFP
ncbi:DUF4433 domain-containing protein [Halomonas lysinitropha]|uniref:DarT domain-containing protein n=1 Tax=Halomonas lysinitropha TaxID=2607506 RepID=A0A5K1HYK6_9GAMM|nr:DUF4433 domain-containing protein [Halomonas lysinitropha]VVZ94624.1 hypothetical protein HALO32_00679 [Halomonas lysinitropha]